MQYRIGDIASILNVSSEMIRYYEKKGVINPIRDKINNYRIYTTQDLFLLMEALQMQDFDVKIKDFHEFTSSAFIENYTEHLQRYKEKLVHQVMETQMLIQRINELITRLETMQYNVDRFWIEKISPYYQYILLESNGDDYGEVQLTDNIRSFIYSQKVYPFFENVVEFQEDHEIWYNAVKMEYGKHLELVESDKIIKTDEKYCLCTIAEMGEMGSFTRKILNPILNYTKENNLIPDGLFRGFLCGRGMHNNHYQRYLKLIMPVKL